MRLWVRGLDPDAKPRRIVGLGGSSSGSPPVWSPDGKQLIISVGHREDPRWIFTTIRVTIDGKVREELAVPPEDCVHDWSPGGRWIVTVSQRGAKSGWQLYVMRPDGTDQRRISKEGNPYSVRFSPDGRRVLYADNGRGKQSGIWVVDVDGKNGRLVLPVDGHGRRPQLDLPRPAGLPMESGSPSLCFDTLGCGRTALLPIRVVVMDLDGGHPFDIDTPEGGSPTDMPDWR